MRSFSVSGWTVSTATSGVGKSSGFISYTALYRMGIQKGFHSNSSFVQYRCPVPGRYGRINRTPPQYGGLFRTFLAVVIRIFHKNRHPYTSDNNIVGSSNTEQQRLQIMSEAFDITETLDVKGASCPMPVVKTKSAIDEARKARSSRYWRRTPGA